MFAVPTPLNECWCEKGSRAIYWDEQGRVGQSSALISSLATIPGTQTPSNKELIVIWDWQPLAHTLIIAKLCSKRLAGTNALHLHIIPWDTHRHRPIPSAGWRDWGMELALARALQRWVLDWRVWAFTVLQSGASQGTGHVAVPGQKLLQNRFR